MRILVVAANALTVITMAIGTVLWATGVSDLESLTSLVIRAAIADGAFHALLLVFIVCFYIFRKIWYK